MRLPSALLLVVFDLTSPKASYDPDLADNTVCTCAVRSIRLQRHRDCDGGGGVCLYTERDFGLHPARQRYTGANGAVSSAEYSEGLILTSTPPKENQRPANDGAASASQSIATNRRLTYLTCRVAASNQSPAIRQIHREAPRKSTAGARVPKTNASHEVPSDT